MQGAALKRILVVEDHALNREFISEVLTGLGCAAHFAIDGEQALIAAATEQFDALLVDINLPDIGGDELLRQLRELPAIETLPAIAMSADLSREKIARLKAGGFDHCLIKPLDIRHLERILTGQNSSNPGSAGDAVDSASAMQPMLDDELALATSGNRDIVRRLRGLFAIELVTERNALFAEADARSFVAMQGRLHRMLAAAGFCGALPLSKACRRLIEALGHQEDTEHFQSVWDEFDRVLSQTLRALETQATEERGFKEDR